jgi:hypothetical protein
MRIRKARRIVYGICLTAPSSGSSLSPRAALTLWCVSMGRFALRSSSTCHMLLLQRSDWLIHRMMIKWRFDAKCHFNCQIKCDFGWRPMAGLLEKPSRRRSRNCAIVTLAFPSRLFPSSLVPHVSCSDSTKMKRGEFLTEKPFGCSDKKLQHVVNLIIY